MSWLWFILGIFVGIIIADLAFFVLLRYGAKLKAEREEKKTEFRW